MQTKHHHQTAVQRPEIQYTIFCMHHSNRSHFLWVGIPDGKTRPAWIRTAFEAVQGMQQIHSSCSFRKAFLNRYKVLLIPHGALQG